MNKKITINEIAEIAKVSKGTVSKIINNREGVGESTRQRVLELMARLHFTPNPSAQALAFNKTSNIGLIVPHLAENSLHAPYWSHLLGSVAKESIENNYNLVLFTPKADGDLEGVYDRIVASKKVDGLVVGAEQFDLSHQEKLEKAKIPYVLIGQSREGLSNYVDVDNFEATKAITEFLIRDRCQRIAYLSGPLNTYHAQSRLAAFIETAQKKKVHHTIQSLRNYESLEVQKCVHSLLNKKNLPDALLLGAGGEFIFDVIAILDEKGLKESLPLCVFDDYPFLDYVQPQITAIRQPLTEMARQAVLMLLRLISKSSIAVERPVIVKSSLVIRKNEREAHFLSKTNF